MSGSKHKIDVRSCSRSARLEYVVLGILTHYWDAKFSIIDRDAKSSNIVISYEQDPLLLSDKSIRIPRSKLLFEKGIQKLEFLSQVIQGQAVAFVIDENEGRYDLEYDLFAFVFYNLSRYEEYGAVDLDHHGRFQSKNSWAVKYQCLDIAYVDRAIFQLEEVVFQKYGVRLTRKNEFSIQASYDIDMPFAYQAKGLKTYLGIFRDIFTANWGGVRTRVSYWKNGKDPFDQYELMRLLSENGPIPNCFVLQNYNPPHDLNHIVGNELWSTIIEKLSSWTQIGIHPSYASNDSVRIVQEEIQQLENIVNQPITRSRQHFLKLKMPDTYRELEKLGINEDHSMMYADNVGFRTGTSHPFPWYDLEEERITSLIIHPYITMDVTMRYYLNQSPEQAIQCVLKLQKEVQTVGGRFGFIWHNSSMSKAYGWAPWVNVLQTCLQHSDQHDSDN